MVSLRIRKKKKQRKESVDVLMDSKREMTLTTRQRALQSSKDASASSSSLIEFPNGLPPAPPRSEHLSVLYFFFYQCHTQSLTMLLNYRTKGEAFRGRPATEES